MSESLPLRELGIQLIYLASALCFIFGLRGLSHPEKARGGMTLAAFGMLLGGGAAMLGGMLGTRCRLDHAGRDLIRSKTGVLQPRPAT